MKETKQITRKRMSSIKSKNSQMELKLRRKLFSLGYRYRVHYKKIYGKPDIIFPRQKIAIFCDSHFWHGYKFNKALKGKLKTNRNYWVNKIEKNIKRDKIVTKRLKNEGWIVIRFWEHQIQNKLDFCVQKIEKYISKY